MGCFPWVGSAKCCSRKRQSVTHRCGQLVPQPTHVPAVMSSPTPHRNSCASGPGWMTCARGLVASEEVLVATIPNFVSCGPTFAPSKQNFVCCGPTFAPSKQNFVCCGPNFGPSKQNFVSCGPNFVCADQTWSGRDQVLFPRNKVLSARSEVLFARIEVLSA